MSSASDLLACASVCAMLSVDWSIVSSWWCRAVSESVKRRWEVRESGRERGGRKQREKREKREDGHE